MSSATLGAIQITSLELIGVPNQEQRPYAELWIGAHTDLPAVARLGDAEVPLPLLLRDAAEVVLGRRDTERFGGRPQPSSSRFSPSR